VTASVSERFYDSRSSWTVCHHAAWGRSVHGGLLISWAAFSSIYTIYPNAVDAKRGCSVICHTLTSQMNWCHLMPAESAGTTDQRHQSCVSFETMVLPKCHMNCSESSKVYFSTVLSEAAKKGLVPVFKRKLDSMCWFSHRHRSGRQQNCITYLLTDVVAWLTATPPLPTSVCWIFA